MTRLNAELRRLYQPLTEADGRVRAMVLGIGQPADWAALSQVWQAVQADWAWPAPAIAVSGVDSYQLWFSLEEAVAPAEARAFLAALCHRHLGHVPAARIASWPGAESAPPGDAVWPGQEVRPGQWSAFVAPDLAPIFADTPWLDIPPSLEGQADLLSRVRPIPSADWRAALPRWQSPAQQLAASSSGPRPSSASGSHQDPRHFLRRVMNDDQVDLALRIEAAKALLPYTP